MRVVPKQSRSQAKIELILSTTAELISEKGADAITMSDIAAACELPIATLYHYFPNKNHIMKTMAEEAIDNIDHELTSAIEAAENHTDWLPLVDFVFQSYKLAPGLVPLFQALRAIPELRGVVDRSNARVAEILAEQIDSNGHLPAERRLTLCRLVSELVQSGLEYALIHCHSDAEQQAVADELKTMLEGIHLHYFG